MTDHGGAASPYHPDPAIDAGIRADALEAERFDLAAGYEARWWVCPECGASHHRGHFLTVGQHRCLRCGYAGPLGTMHINDPRPRLAEERLARAVAEIAALEPLDDWIARNRELR